MAFSRYFDSALQSWWKRPDRKPLILRGARQTGKSTAVRELGKKARQFIELNFERHRDLQIVRSCNSPEQLLQRLKEVFNFADFPSGTLLFLDEVQEHPDAINWLRFFYEDFPQIAVVAAGSLMEVRLRDSALPFPVGRVEFLRIEPLTFLDFLDATSNIQLASSLRNEFSNPDGIPEGLHQLAMDKFRSFLLVGGMPEAVAKWDASADWNEVGLVHESLQQAYLEDLLKYGVRTGTTILETVLAAAPNFYGSRFKLQELAVEWRSKALSEAMALLEKAMVLHRARPTYHMQLPLIPRARAAHKLIPLDMGLALSQWGVRPQHLATTKVEGLLGGRVAEAFVGVQLLARNPHRSRDLHFWTRESKASSSAEIDYLLPTENGVLPIEVKSGASGSLKSLHQYLAASDGAVGIRLNSGTGGVEKLQAHLPQGGRLNYFLHTYPLYLVELIG